MTQRERGQAQQRARHEQEILRKIHLNAAGIDIGSASHWVAVPDDRDDQPVREFTSFTHDLTALATWLEACGIDTVAMESTGVYWIPLYELLEARGIEVLLVNAHHVKGVPGRKSDILDCQWLQQLHTFGLLRGSFRPDAPIAALRSVIRHRDQLVESAASWVQRMQKALVLMNLQLHHVLTDVTGVTGVAILRDIVAGETDSAVLARHRDPRCKATEAEIAAALTGHYRAEHVFVLRQALEGYDFYQTQIGRCDDEIQGQIRALEATCQTPDEPPDPPRPARRRSANEPRLRDPGPAVYAVRRRRPDRDPRPGAVWGRSNSCPRSASICVAGRRRSTSPRGSPSRPGTRSPGASSSAPARNRRPIGRQRPSAWPP